MLNTPGVVTDADLHVLGGDLEGEGLFGRLKTLITDAYYREDHDLVVNTPSMLGGTARTKPVRYWIDQGASVTHFHYFSRPDTSARLTSALKGDSSQFHVLEAEPSSVSMDDYRKRAATPQPTVVVVPGIMGSELRLGTRRVWLELLALAGGGLSRLGADAAGVEATGLVANNYAELCRFLANSHTVVPFPYDWRLGIGPAGDRLATTLSAIADQAEATNQPVRIIAHSMGGLVVRAMLATKAGAAVWARLASHPASRIVMLGTPNGGSHAIAALLLGRDSLVRKLALLDLRHDHAGLLETIAAFDGVLDLLPGDGQGLDLFNRKTWDELFLLDAPQDRGIFGASGVASSKSAGFRWSPPEAGRLQAARKRREGLLAAWPEPGRLIYVAGVADETASDVVIDRQAEPTRRVKVMATTEGDGRVLWSTGIPQGAAVFYMDATHGDLANTGWAFPALLDLLTSGHTSKLPATPPRRRSARQTFELRVREPEMLPDEADLVATATGGTRSKSHRKDAPDELMAPCGSRQSRARVVCRAHRPLPGRCDRRRGSVSRPAVESTIVGAATDGALRRRAAERGCGAERHWRPGEAAPGRNRRRPRARRRAHTGPTGIRARARADDVWRGVGGAKQTRTPAGVAAGGRRRDSHRGDVAPRRFRRRRRGRWPTASRRSRGPSRARTGGSARPEIRRQVRRRWRFASHAWTSSSCTRIAPSKPRMPCSGWRGAARTKASSSPICCRSGAAACGGLDTILARRGGSGSASPLPSVRTRRRCATRRRSAGCSSRR